MEMSWIFVVEDDLPTCRVYSAVAEQVPDTVVRAYGTAGALLEAWTPAQHGVLLLDHNLPDMTASDFVARYVPRPFDLPILVVSAATSVPMAVKLVAAGVVDVVEKPVPLATLRARLAALVESERVGRADRLAARAYRESIHALTPREAEVLEHLLAGKSNKEAGWDLGISQRTIEIHRARILAKLNARSLVDAARFRALDERHSPRRA